MKAIERTHFTLAVQRKTPWAVTDQINISKLISKTGHLYRLVWNKSYDSHKSYGNALLKLIKQVNKQRKIKGKEEILFFPKKTTEGIYKGHFPPAELKCGVFCLCPHEMKP